MCSGAWTGFSTQQRRPPHAEGRERETARLAWSCHTEWSSWFNEWISSLVWQHLPEAPSYMSLFVFCLLLIADIRRIINAIIESICGLWFVVCAKQPHGPKYNHDRKNEVREKTKFEEWQCRKVAFNELSILTELRCFIKLRTKLILLHLSLSLSRLRYGAI